jgi:hypothetical protein
MVGDVVIPVTSSVRLIVDVMAVNAQDDVNRRGQDEDPS